jgi:hypothetical protein
MVKRISALSKVEGPGISMVPMILPRRKPERKRQPSLWRTREWPVPRALGGRALWRCLRWETGGARVPEGSGRAGFLWKAVECPTPRSSKGRHPQGRGGER